MTQDINDGLWRVVGSLSGCPLADRAEKVALGLERRLEDLGSFELERRSAGTLTRVLACWEDGAFVTWRHSRLVLLNASVTSVSCCKVGFSERYSDPAFVQVELCSNGKFEHRLMRPADYGLLSDCARREVARATIGVMTLV